MVDFPETRVAVVEHHGPPDLEGQSVKKLVDWRIENGIPPSPMHRQYGLHFNDPREVSAEEYRVDLCVSVETEINTNSYGVINKIIPACRCAKIRHVGSREHIPAAQYLFRQWLPMSGEQYSGLPLIFHYVNIGPGIPSHEMITDVYLPLI